MLMPYEWFDDDDFEWDWFAGGYRKRPKPKVMKKRHKSLYGNHA